MEKNLDCFSAALYLGGFDKEEEPITQLALKQILENRKLFQKVKIQNIGNKDIIIFPEKFDDLHPYKCAYVMKNSKTKILIHRPIPNEKISLTNLPLELKRKNMDPRKVLVYRLKEE